MFGTGDALSGAIALQFPENSGGWNHRTSTRLSRASGRGFVGFPRAAPQPVTVVSVESTAVGSVHKVSIACGSIGPLGEMVHAQRLAEHIPRPGFEVSLVALAGGDADLPRPGTAPVQIVPVSADSTQHERAEALAAAIERTEPSVVIAEDVVSGLAALRLRSRHPDAALVRTIHHLDAEHELESQEAQRLSLESADACVCVSGYWSARVREELGVEAVVVPNGVDHARFAAPGLDRDAARARLGWDDRPVVLSVGGVGARKGSLALIEAFGRARVRIGDDALLAIVGGPSPKPRYLERFLDEADRLGIGVARGRAEPGRALALLETQASDAMPELYRAADAFALPSTREGFGLAALEAAAGGLPVVLSDLAVFRERFEHDRDCLMVPVGDSGPLADALVRVMRDPALAERLGRSAQVTASGLTWEAAAEAYAKLIGELPGSLTS
ncbi:MAG: glycosyltransferase [Miltoncostaeaceae bacterium]